VGWGYEMGGAKTGSRSQWRKWRSGTARQAACKQTAHSLQQLVGLELESGLVKPGVVTPIVWEEATSDSDCGVAIPGEVA